MHKYRDGNMYVNVESFSEKSLVLFEVMLFLRSFSQGPNLLLLLQAAPASARAARVSAVTVAWPTWGLKKFYQLVFPGFDPLELTTRHKNITIYTHSFVKSRFVK